MLPHLKVCAGLIDNENMCNRGAIERVADDRVRRGTCGCGRKGGHHAERSG